MTLEYIIKRIYNKTRITADFDLLAIRKLISGYIYFITIMTLFDIAFFLSYFSLIDKSLSLELSNEFIIIMNIVLVFSLYRVWRNNKNFKYKFPNPQNYQEDIKDYSQEDLRILVKQINDRHRLMQRIVNSMLKDQFIGPIIIVAASSFKAYDMISKGLNNDDLVLLFLLITSIASGIGFIIGIRKNPTSFKYLQRSISYKVRNIIIDSIIYSNLNPGSNEIRKPNK